MGNQVYIAIDLKSFYASVECADRRLDPLTTNLVVADPTRTDKTICLAVSPSLKAYGISGRARMFEVLQKVQEINARRRRFAPWGRFSGRSVHAPDLNCNPSLELDFITAPPRMARYMEISTKIYGIYLKYVAKEDIHVYSIDEVFIDAAKYLRLYKTTAREFTRRLIQEVLDSTGITATAGIGTNLYLCKIAMDIVAKHIPADQDGVRIAELDEMSYRRQLWTHRPLTDFWRIGNGYADKLQRHGMYTMGDVARMSLVNEEMLYLMFGVQAELLIDHAWGWEPCSMEAIHNYKAKSNSLSSGQVLQNPYEFAQARLVTLEMSDQLALDLVEKGLVTDQIVLTIGYDVENLTDSRRRAAYHGPVVSDHYDRLLPKDAHGSIRLKCWTSSARLIDDATMELFDRIVDKTLLVRRITVVAGTVILERDIPAETSPEQLDLFVDYQQQEATEAQEKKDLAKEKRCQEAMLAIRRSLGKNAILKGMNLEKGATGRERNRQIGGHKA